MTSQDRNNIFELARLTCGLVLERDQKVSFKIWAQKIGEVYELRNPKVKLVHDVLLTSPKATVSKDRYGSIKLYF